ncbi:hypothetical protein CCHR01_19488 [Colletotrichum chrysophilum]|uniref:Uncharacterized protein n=1 Tax=Colletotrichum chrysophilum TaxID=1836956 RepID=A0AAD8ZYI2_9PEZI|nr:hypothetical protein CCHR01_19488 [Colletotrichum chrysophilum]
MLAASVQVRIRSTTSAIHREDAGDPEPHSTYPQPGNEYPPTGVGAEPCPHFTILANGFLPCAFCMCKPSETYSETRRIDEGKKLNAGTPKVSGQLPAKIIPYSSCHRISSLGRNHSKLLKNLQHPRPSPIVGMDSPPPGPSGSDPPPEPRQPPFLGPWP